ncbi:MAG: hypothetical protein WDO73_21265 [Ignavibacteriota bacterium]
MSQNLEMATRRYCEEQRLPLANVLWNPTHHTYLQLGLDSVPNLIVVDHSGVVQKVWSGQLSPQRWRELAEYTGVPYQAVISEGTSASKLPH